MAIRFQCGACSQPIEIDDEWALKAVACPYCRKTVTAPAESTLGDVAAIPTASPLQPPPPPPVSPAASADIPGVPYGAVAVDSRPNRLAVVAMVLATLLVAILVALTITIRAHSQELEEITKLSMEALSSGGVSAYIKAQEDYMAAHGGMPAWLIAMTGLQIVFIPMWIAALVCAVIAMRRQQRRAHAVAALVLCVVTPFLLCCGGPLLG